ncbi:type I-G CRISPR-associated helicase/endonuclease Cas3g [Azospirillum lipoferum]|uniref:Helicase (CRISPR associated) n=1 Tax=Azospirillum lipoferum (strain 4B) TaxID=862719 RepID=G7Z1U1_AZOL4|nr:CRISPR-associated endonuclease Cas3'' [Azospirillum lipoferum]CBS87256.1 putative helicase (CRISPR associated) [Azospirillum lipoferum 4B]
MTSFDSFFARAMGDSCQSYEYQRRLALEPWPEVMIAPTGVGKTAAVVLGWLWRRQNAPDDTPLRLVLCLPMRSLVEQTRDRVEDWLKKLGARTDPSLPHPEHGLAVLMGGGEREKQPPAWVQTPERPAILIGTQDMLLSRALMRGYGISRFRWPVDFALLHNDAQWVFDEVQAMGAGLATSTQLQGLRTAMGTARPSRSLWMSATLDPAWLATVDHKAPDRVLRVPHDVPADQDNPDLRRLIDARKHLRPAATRPAGAGAKDRDAYTTALAGEVLEAHRHGTTTLVILNTVARAQAVYGTLKKQMGAAAGDRLLLIHARFRPRERTEQLKRLTGEGAGRDRIVVATQAVEAGIDVSSALLVTELAPWSSLVQRFGRVNRYGECQNGAEIRWIDLSLSKEEDPKGEMALPYAAEDLAAARDRLAGLDDNDAAPAKLSPTDRPPPVRHVLRRKDLLDLFDTDPDLTGFDIDVSPFIRDAKDTDFQVLWRDIPDEATARRQPLPDRDELCSVPIRRAEDLLKGRQGWRLNPQAKGSDSTWMRLDGKPWPGLVVMLDAAQGGYDPDIGLAPEMTKEKVPVLAPPDGPEDTATAPHIESPNDDRDSRQDHAVLLAEHLGNVAAAAERLCADLHRTVAMPAPDHAAVVTAARWHDVGKAHDEFQARMVEPARPPGTLLAKAEKYERAKGRPYFRHELASALAYLDQNGGTASADLVAYLIAAHHGKVRLSLRALPQEKPPADICRFARGIHEGDPLPAVDLGDGSRSEALSLSLRLMELGADEDGDPSWASRTARLLADHRPFRLAWLESLVRIADWRASAAEQEKARQEKAGKAVVGREDGDDGR